MHTSYTYVYTYMYVHTYIHTYRYTGTYRHIQAHTGTYRHIQVYRHIYCTLYRYNVGTCTYLYLHPAEAGLLLGLRPVWKFSYALFIALRTVDVTVYQQRQTVNKECH
jgi:hypothetical protein